MPRRSADASSELRNTTTTLGRFGALVMVLRRIAELHGARSRRAAAPPQSGRAAGSVAAGSAVEGSNICLTHRVVVFPIDRNENSDLKWATNHLID